MCAMAMNNAEMVRMKMQKHVEVRVHHDHLLEIAQYSYKLNDTKQQQYNGILNDTQ
jgi:hypothetical protein